MSNDDFNLVGAELPQKLLPVAGCKKRKKNKPIIPVVLLAAILLGCLFAEIIMNHSPTYMNLADAGTPPCAKFWFGTDAMGRDIFSMLWYGGRISLFIGLTATAISLFIAVLYGSISGFACEAVDDAMMRITEILISIPSILIIILIQAAIGQNNPLSVALVIGLTGWMNIAKMVRGEVLQIRSNNYIIASKCMNGSFWHVLRYHVLPNLVSPLLFMAVTSVGSAIAAESTLSFLGIGLPLEVVSWGSMLSLADRALLSGDWWVILIPGLFLVVTLVCITDIGNYLRKENNRGCSYL